MIRAFLVLAMFLCGFTTYGLADDDQPADYKVGGQKFVPPAEYEHELCHSPFFKCYPVKSNETWRGLFSDDSKRSLVQRINRTNVPLQYLNEIILPVDIKNISYKAISPLPAHLDTGGQRLVYVDLNHFAFAAYDEQGNRVLWGPASGGKPWCDDTKTSCLTATGTFHVYRIKGADCTSGTYPLETDGGAQMPYCMYFYKGFAMHGSTLSGFVNRSRGCVRLFDEDAKWLNENFVKIGTEVIVK